jgi:hypothetical protein
MMRKLFPVVLVALLVSSCGNKSGKEISGNNSADDKPVKVEFASLAANPADYIDKNIEVKGKVVHVCTHTGKKMFIVGENPDVMLYVSAGESASKFPMELLGSQISVEGHIEKVITADKPVEQTMVASMETAACCDSSKAGGMECADSTKTAAECETEAALAKQTALADLMMIYNKHEVVK